MSVNLQWLTVEADKSIAFMARVSNPNAIPDDPSDKLIAYLIKHKHWSPFEMANACLEISTTRDIARQILRHRSFHFQEFSQRYSEAPEDRVESEARLQDKKNRQNSLPLNTLSLDDEDSVRFMWAWIQKEAWDRTYHGYKEALKLGIAKEVARKLLPEGLTRTRMYMNGTLRDWIHYLSVRLGPETQLEHRQIAEEIRDVLTYHCPVVMAAAGQAGLIAPANTG